MTTAKHTPGPWRVEGAPDTAIEILAIPNEGTEVVVVASVPDEFGQPEITMADAKLIAAAPALAAALKAMLASHREMNAPYSATNQLTRADRDAMERREKVAVDAASDALRAAGLQP